MATRKYRGYVVPNRDSFHPDRWAIKFPDFPMLEITAGNEALISAGMITEKCCGMIVDTIIDMLRIGLEIPTPHRPLNYAPFIEISVDVEVIMKASNRKTPVGKPN